MNSGYNTMGPSYIQYKICKIVIDLFKEKETKVTFLNFSCLQLSDFSPSIQSFLIKIDRYRFAAMCRQVLKNGAPLSWDD